MDTHVACDTQDAGGDKQTPFEVILDVTKEAAAPANPPPQSHGGRAPATLMVLTLGILLALLGPLMWMLIGHRVEIQQHGFQVRAVEDSLDDLMKAFAWGGVEKSDHGCISCFFQDTGRVRRAFTSSEAFLVYKGDDLEHFEIMTHVFDTNPEVVRDAPFSFFTAPDTDADGQPDAWQPVAAGYRPEGSVMGWSRGVFHGQFPPMHAFIKVTLHDMPGTWRPQVGQVALFGGADPVATAQPTETQGLDIFSFIDQFLERMVTPCNRGQNALDVPLASVDTADPLDQPTDETLALRAAAEAGTTVDNTEDGATEILDTDIEVETAADTGDETDEAFELDDATLMDFYKAAAAQAAEADRTMADVPARAGGAEAGEMPIAKGPGLTNDATKTAAEAPLGLLATQGSD
eukprot:TRINITY_DN802_c0_g1_i1.p1 TRINITY_DN802_c0_g1~~TRINITY_DN802_c0_g1_i1.p1  ORF type:complete len:414 (-),score=102.87 TRINITY_DN802_c0_g1_i1:37-1251(-)